MSPPTYEVSRAFDPPPADLLGERWWGTAPAAAIACVRPESTRADVQARARLMWSEAGLFGRFDVLDHGVRVVRQGFGVDVWKDSCVELFLEPKAGRGYFNFEFSAGGAWLASHVLRPARAPDGRLLGARRLSPAEVAGARVRATLPPRVEPPMAGPVEWRLAFFLPWTVFAAASLGRPLPGEVWRGNFYKCGDETPFPHWMSWSPVDALDFHRPDCFGQMRFVGPAKPPAAQGAG